MKAKMKFLIFGGLAFAFNACSSDKEDPLPKPTITETIPTPASFDKRETFTFASNGTNIKGKIFVPSEHENNKNLPAIYLLDFTEQHFQVATDEFDRVIEGVHAVKGLNALVITLDEHMNIDYAEKDFQEYSDVYKNMASYVDDNYTGNTSRTFIGRGSEAGHILMTLFLEEKETSVFQNFIATDTPNMGRIIAMIENDNFPQEKDNKKLHYSFSFEADYYDANIKLIDIINEQAYPWLDFKSVEYPNLTYETGYPTAFRDGIKFIFED